MRNRFALIIFHFLYTISLFSMKNKKKLQRYLIYILCLVYHEQDLYSTQSCVCGGSRIFFLIVNMIISKIYVRYQSYVKENHTIYIQPSIAQYFSLETSKYTFICKMFVGAGWGMGESALWYMQKDCLHKHDINLKFDTNEQIIHKK